MPGQWILPGGYEDLVLIAAAIATTVAVVVVAMCGIKWLVERATKGELVVLWVSLMALYVFFRASDAQ